MPRLKMWLVGAPAALSSLLLAGAAHAQVDTSAITAAVNTGVSSGTETVGDFISANIASLLILAAVVIGTLLVIRLFRRVAR